MSAANPDSQPTEREPAPGLNSTQGSASVPGTRFEVDAKAENSTDSLLTRLPDDPYATAIPGAGTDTLLDLRSSDAIPGYELLATLGQGGMGIVWKARQIRLNRVVALKMVLGEHRVGARELIRFLAEAEAVASVKHPHVVQVHEYGDANGRPFLAMEFLPGGSLADRLKKETRLHPRAAAELVATLAGAVQAAHDQGIVHRDLKPANVLFDDANQPKVTDFGLAKRAGGTDITATQAVMGTPAYMAPEQARGNTRFVGPQADLYSLGVILYECLTGQLPFRAESTLALLRKVAETVPPRPSTIRPGLDRDLETIVLKCLEKDPAQRYPTAGDLLHDLNCWSEGRPIAARPVGQVERFARWCQRNPVVAGLIATIALSLVLGAVVSTRFALRERDEANRARKAEDLARDEANRAIKAQAEAVAARDETERTFARSLVRPLDVDGEAKSDLSDTEVEVLWDLASQQSESLRDRFLSEALSRPFPLRQLYARAEPSLIAALGLDPDRRSRASRRIVETLERPNLPLEARVHLSFLLLKIEDGPDPKIEQAWKTILQALESDLDPSARAALETKVLGSLDTIAPARCVSFLDAMLGKQPSSETLSSLSTSVGQIPKQLQPAAAAAIARSIVNAIERNKDSKSQKDLAVALSDLSDRLEPAEAAIIARSIVHAIKRNKDSKIRLDLSRALYRLTDRLEPTEAAIIARAFVDLLALEPDIKSRCSMLTDSTSIIHSSFPLFRRLPPAESRAHCGLLAQSIADELARGTSASDGESLVNMMTALASFLTPAEAAGICGPVARSIADELGREKEAKARSNLSRSLASLSGYLDPAEVAKIVPLVTASLDRESNADARSSLADTLSSLSKRLDRGEAAALSRPVARSIAEAIQRESNDSARTSLIKSLVSLASRLDPAEAKELTRPVARSIAEAIQRQTNVSARDSLIRGLESLASGLDPVDLKEMIGPVARSLAEAIQRQTNISARDSLIHSVASLASVLDLAEVKELTNLATGSIAEAIQRESNDPARFSAMGSLNSVSSGLIDSLRLLRKRHDPAEEKELMNSTARSIFESFGNEKDPLVQSSLANVLSDLSDDLAPAETTIMARSIINALSRKPSLEAQSNLCSALSRLVGRIDPADASALCGTAALFVFDSTYLDPNGKLGYSLANSVESLANFLRPADAPKFARSLVEAIGREPDGNARSTLVSTLVSLSDRFENERILRLVATALQFSPGGMQALINGEAGEPVSYLLETPEIVDLLKMPTCYGDTRRLLLDKLGKMYGRPFANHWEFVRFAQENGLKLDLTSPPRRPDQNRLPGGDRSR